PLSPECLSWLREAGYSHVVWGCAQEPLPNIGISGVRCVHSLHHLSENGRDLLIVDHLTEDIVARLNQNFRVIWVPRKGQDSLALQARMWPREHANRLYIFWPHSTLLHQFGWTWDEFVAAHNHLAKSFPYLKLRPPEGWDLYNPQISENLGLDLQPKSVI